MKESTLKDLVGQGLSIRRISKATGKAATTVRFWLDKYGIETRTKRNSGKRWTDEQMTEAIRQSETISDVLVKVGLAVRPGNYDTVRNFVRKHNISTDHMIGKASGRGRAKPLLDEEVFSGESTISRHTLKKYVMRNGIFPNECSLCHHGPEWKGEPLVMVLDHIDGNNRNCLKGNLRLLCPNCNSQQETFCRKNGKRASAVIAPV